MLMIYQAGVVSKWTNDSQRFLLEHFDTIQNSPSHIYHSALSLSPSSSWLHKCYSTELSHIVMVVKGLPAEWGMCSRTVLLDSYTWALAYHNNSIAVGREPGDIVILSAITGSQTAVLSGHMGIVTCFTFLPDGTSIVSGSIDETVKLWDAQTGGVVKTFSGHTDSVRSVSISADCTIIASGSRDETIRLWDIQAGECQHVIMQQGAVEHIIFSPTNPKHLISICDGKLWQLDTNGHQIRPPHNGSHIAFSPNGTQFVSCYEGVITVQHPSSGVIVAEFQVTNGYTQYCCSSPDGRLVAIAGDNTVYVFDITSSDPHLVETFIGHTEHITSLVFSSPTTLISASRDRSVKFWQIEAPSADLVVAGQKSTFFTSAPIMSIALQAKDGITITTDSDGMVKTWDIPTGLCKASFQTPAKDPCKKDVQLIDGRLILVWGLEQMIHILDVETGEILLEIDCGEDLDDLRISGDGSRIFSLSSYYIYSWSVQTGKVMNKGIVEYSSSIGSLGSLVVNGSKVWVHSPQSEYEGWDFGIIGSSPIWLSNMPILPIGRILWDPRQAMIKNGDTGEVVFQLCGGFAEPTDVQCDGSYLVAGYHSGEILIVELKYI
jgi:WD40 repeat protein